MASIVMAFIAMAYIVMAYMIMALYRVQSNPHSMVMPFNFFDEIAESLTYFNLCIDVLARPKCLSTALTTFILSDDSGSAHWPATGPRPSQNLAALSPAGDRELRPQPGMERSDPSRGWRDPSPAQPGMESSDPSRGAPSPAGDGEIRASSPSPAGHGELRAQPGMKSSDPKPGMESSEPSRAWRAPTPAGHGELQAHRVQRLSSHCIVTVSSLYRHCIVTVS